ncbi:MAG: response regulator [Rhodomicrobium sp.]
MRVFRCPIVLIVEDEPLLRMDGADIVADAGFEVLTAANADQAILILQCRDNIEVVFTDIDMPGAMDGLKLARVIRHRWPPVKFLFTSGYVMTPEQSIPTGGLFLSKPYEPSRIAQALRELTA